MKTIVRFVSVNMLKEDKQKLYDKLHQKGLYDWMRCGWFLIDKKHSLFRETKFFVIAPAEMLKYHKDMLEDIEYIDEGSIPNIDDCWRISDLNTKEEDW